MGLSTPLEDRADTNGWIFKALAKHQEIFFWMFHVGWVLKNWSFWTCGVGEDSWESLDCKEIKPVNPKGNQSWIFIGRTDAEAEAPILWPPDAKSWLIRKDPDARKDWRQEEQRRTEDEMVGWHHHWGMQWTWVWASSGRWWRTEKSGMLQSTRLKRDGPDWATEQQHVHQDICLLEEVMNSCLWPSYQRTQMEIRCFLAGCWLSL